MSDLWALRDYISTHYNRRYCSYDPPGTGWSDPAVNTQVAGSDLITAQVMEAMNEPGPFICLGSMDDGDIRCLKYCLTKPSNCKAIVPVSFGAQPEFQLYTDYYGGSVADQVAMAKAVMSSRMAYGNVINFFAVSWGLIASFIPAGDYEPADQAYESHFLNVMNEKQWSTNTNFLYQATVDPYSVMSVVGQSYWDSPEAKTLPASVPIFGFTLGQTADQINQQCKLYDYPLGSKDCNFLYYTYNTTMTNDLAIVARNPASKLFVCWDECKSANGNGFLLDQNSMVPWFAQTLWGAIQNITV